MRKQRAALRRPGAAALDLCYVAAGRYDGFWEIGLNSWDTCAGIVMVREAGGQVTDMNGGGDVLGNKGIVAGNQELHPALVKALNATFALGGDVPHHYALWPLRPGRWHLVEWVAHAMQNDTSAMPDDAAGRGRAV